MHQLLRLPWKNLQLRRHHQRLLFQGVNSIASQTFPGIHLKVEHQQHLRSNWMNLQLHRHHQDHPATPFTVGIIELVDGPVIKAIVQGEEASVGSPVEGKLVPTEITDNGTQLVDFYFQVVK